ncbi:MAG TPA: hypothetical protein VM617_04330, partial [Thermoanaerobaculia bacterium]|nr:hypothetical protein [Thermoanaerobaculia bacterium]
MPSDLLPPPGRATATAPANIAFVKYWGARDLERALPVNPSLSMTLSACRARTTVEFWPASGDDEVWLGADEPLGDATVVIGREALGEAMIAAGSRAAGGRPGDHHRLRDPGPAFSSRVLAHLDNLRRQGG